MTSRRWIVAVLMAALLFAAFSGDSSSTQWWAILAPAFLALGLVALTIKGLRPYAAALPVSPVRPTRSSRGPPLP